MHLKYSIGIWVQSRKEDKILRLDLNPYWVIFKLLTFSRWLWDPCITGAGLSVDESARCSPARWQGCFTAFTSESGSWIGSIGLLSLISFFWVLFERLLPIPMELAPAYVGVVFSLFILDCMVMYILLFLFYLFCDFSYFIHLAFRTRVSSCVCDGI
jgi:hypothetical protein